MVIHWFSIVLDIAHNYSSFVFKMGRVLLFLNWAKPGLFFVYFRSFHNTMTNIAQI